METSTEKSQVVLRKKPPYTCRFEVVPGKPCAAILTEEDDDLCRDCVTRKPGELKPLLSVPAESNIVTPKPHWPFWPGA